MPVPAPYAVLQKEAARPTAEQIRRAFRSFSHLTDADAVRLAANAQGILQRQLSADAARAFLRALQAEGVAAAIVAESELQLLPQSKSLHRLALTEAALEVYDLHGQPTAVPWGELVLIAAGTVRPTKSAYTELSDPLRLPVGEQSLANKERGIRMQVTSRLAIGPGACAFRRGAPL